MALVMRSCGTRRSAFRKFHSCATLQVKWRNKYRHTTGFMDEDDDDPPTKKYIEYERRVERAAQKRDLRNLARTITFEDLEEPQYTYGGDTQRRSTRKTPSKSRQTNEWEAYLKYEGDWERFCKKFTRFAEFEQPIKRRGGAPSRRGRLHDWEFMSDDEELSDDGWENSKEQDPAFKSRTTTSKTKKHVTITIGQRTDRVALGLPPTGSLTMDELKAAFRASALKWHPDRHDGPSKDMAEEKFKACGNAYRALCTALSEC